MSFNSQPTADSPENSPQEIEARDAAREVIAHQNRIGPDRGMYINPNPAPGDKHLWFGKKREDSKLEFIPFDDPRAEATLKEYYLLDKDIAELG
ncbi:MAG TPA: hypothetical protein VJH67_03825 [Candidatus Paceibacterota bacterium]